MSYFADPKSTVNPNRLKPRDVQRVLTFALRGTHLESDSERTAVDLVMRTLQRLACYVVLKEYMLSRITEANSCFAWSRVLPAHRLPGFRIKVCPPNALLEEERTSLFWRPKGETYDFLLPPLEVVHVDLRDAAVTDGIHDTNGGFVFRAMHGHLSHTHHIVYPVLAKGVIVGVEF